FFSSRRRHTRWPRDSSSDVCSSDLVRLARLSKPSFSICMSAMAQMLSVIAWVGNAALTAAVLFLWPNALSAAPVAGTTPDFAREIGRASCREGVYVSGVECVVQVKQ